AAERARRELVEAAERHGVTASFDIVRGPSASVLAAGSDTDLVVAGTSTRPIGAHFRVDCRWWSSLEAASGPLLLARRGGAEGAVILLLGERGAAAAQMLEIEVAAVESTRP